MKCIKCGFNNQDGSSKCIYCGEALENNNKKLKKKYIDKNKVLVTCVFLLVIVVVEIMVLSTLKN